MKENKISVMLLGDSIRMHYESEVKRKLGDGYKVWSPQENCRFSAYGLNSLRFYLAEFPSPDIIHFNLGLWDAAVLYKKDGCFIGVKEYVCNMKKLLRELKETGAKIIFATTTPVGEEKKNWVGSMPPAHNNDDIIKYNKAVLKKYEKENVIINDLFSLIYGKEKELLTDDLIHPNEKGIEILSNAVAEKIKSLGKIKNTNLKNENNNIANDEKTKQ